MRLTDVALSTAQKQEFGLFNTSLPCFHMSLKWGAFKTSNVQSPSSRLIGLGWSPGTSMF